MKREQKNKKKKNKRRELLRYTNVYILNQESRVYSSKIEGGGREMDGNGSRNSVQIAKGIKNKLKMARISTNARSDSGLRVGVITESNLR